jgi:hypothetical protein
MTEYIFYYILLDSDFSSLNELYSKPSKLSFYIFGNLRETDNMKSNMPVVFDLEDAKNIASRMIDTTIENGSCFSNKKNYPVFGAVIIKMKLLLNKDAVSENKVVFNEDGTRNYSDLIKNNSLSIYYINNKTSNRVKRGILSKSLFNNIELMSAQYVRSRNSNENGWAILNSFNNITANDIRCLKIIYDSNKEIEINRITNNISIVNLLKKNNISPIVYMNDGVNDRMTGSGKKSLDEMNENELRHEVKKLKADYLAKKAASNKFGGAPKPLNSMNENELRHQVKEIKNNYLAKKAEINRSGGGVVEKSLDSMSEQELRKKLKKVKAEYLQKKIIFKYERR